MDESLSVSQVVKRAACPGRCRPSAGWLCSSRAGSCRRWPAASRCGRHCADCPTARAARPGRTCITRFDRSRTSVSEMRRTMWWRGDLLRIGPARPPAPVPAARAACCGGSLRTRSALVSTTSAFWRCGSCVVTPVGQWPVWQVCAWMQPSVIMKPRAALHQSAPSAIMRARSKAETTLPAQPSLTRSRRFTPTSVLCTSSSPSCSGAPDVVGELHRRGAGAALRAIDHDEIRRDAGLLHRLDDGKDHSPWMAEAELEAGRLAARQLAQAGDEMHHLDRRGKGAVRRRRDAVDADRNAARRGDLGRDLRARQHAAVAGFRALAQLDLDHAHLRVGRCLDEALLR